MSLWQDFKDEIKHDWQKLDEKIEDKLSACLSARDWETFFREAFGRHRSDDDDILYDSENDTKTDGSAADRTEEFRLEEPKLEESTPEEKRAGAADTADKTEATDKTPLAETRTETRIAWEKDVATCYEKAKASGKPMIVLFATDWCGYCYKLENEILCQDEMQKYLDKGVFVIANPEKDGDAKELATGLKIDGYPAMSVIDVKSDGLFERGRIIGLLTPEKFFTQMAQYLPAFDGPTSLRPVNGPSPSVVV